MILSNTTYKAFRHRGLKIILFMLYFCCCTNIFAQNSEWIKIGDEAMADGFYQSALQNYKKALHSNKKNDVQLLYKCAEAARLYSNYKDADMFYNRIAALGKAELFPELYFYKGTVYRYLDSAQSALAAYEKYLLQKPDNKKHRQEAQHAVEMCKWALANPALEKEFTVEHLSNKINTKNSEWGAVMVGEGVLLFSSLREYKSPSLGGESDADILSAIYQSNFRKDRYTVAALNEWGLNDERKHTSNVCLDKKNNRLYFTRCRISENYSERQLCEIYYKDLDKKNAKAKKLCPEINIPSYTATQPAVAYNDDKTILFFVSDRPGGFGGMDIWYSIIDEEGKCAVPVNLGSTINTVGDEITPYYDAGNQILYFSSDYHNGYGGFDIFMAKDSLFHFQTPVNMGKPINSSANDTYFTINTFSDSTKGFLTSNREGSFFIDNATCCNDIYSWSFQKKYRSGEDSVLDPSKLPYDSTSLAGKSKSKTNLIFDPSTSYDSTSREGKDKSKIDLVFDPSKTSYDSISLAQKNRLKTDSNIKNPKTTFDTINLVQKYKSRIDSLLPIKLYFDNDEPNPRTKKMTTEYSYNDLVDSYLKKENTYKKEYSKGLDEEESEDAVQKIDDFFEQEVKHNNAQFKTFTTLLLRDLEKGSQIRLVVKGYASPLHTSAYNEYLSKRRISSILNSLLQAEDGSLAKYINKEGLYRGSLEIVELALGSATASETVSNNPHDLRNSVYSVLAAKERRVEILQYNYNSQASENLADTKSTPNNTDSKSVLELKRSLFSVGEIPAKKRTRLEIPVYNSSNEPQTIEVLESGCSCTKVFIKPVIQPKENGIIFVEIDASKEKAGTYVLVPLTIKVSSENFSQTIFIEYQVTNN